MVYTSMSRDNSVQHLNTLSLNSGQINNIKLKKLQVQDSSEEGEDSMYLDTPGGLKRGLIKNSSMVQINTGVTTHSTRRLIGSHSTLNTK